ncbi:DUF881 domain-containing protein [Blastococcus saxobsidens]|uniref:DUF881 domain-containing protein n=1 Tax=Blastococcus saxobsidens TaxID=138336 RepID=A0A6L9W0C5_9ACTN|nr:DUF881 domain-containing protein [Blastococcus saxobsidens]NEK85139.1 DUF881 domain-containing protein [Blastococcus saxobsidens]
MDEESTTDDGTPRPHADDTSATSRATPEPRPDDADPEAPVAAGAASEAEDVPAEDAPTEDGADGDGEPATTQQDSTSGRGSGRSRAWSRPMAVAASTVVALVLGFALTVQIRSTSEPDTPVVSREEDLVLILDELDSREEQLRRQLSQTRQTVEELSTGQQKSGRAAEEARARAEAIGILNGTLPASGPGIVMTIQDPDGAVPTSVVLGAIQELRGAGAEAMEIDGVRVVVSSAVTGSPGNLRIDGVPLDSPYEFRVVGPAPAMEIALNVSGGVVADVGRVGGAAVVRQTDVVTVDATVG